MSRVLLDTDIFSEVLKGKNPVVAARAKKYQSVVGTLTVSAVTVMEVVKGFHKQGQESRLLQFLDALPSLEVLVLDADAAAIAGRIYADLERTGRPIGRADPMIAGIALRHGLPLVTGNTAHFTRVVSLGYPLLLDDWRYAN